MLEEGTDTKAGRRGAPSQLTRRELWFLLTLAGIQFTHILDFVLVMPLGPAFERSLHLTTPQFGWVVSAYAFSASLSGLLAAWLLDRFDRKHTLLVLYTGFILGTLLCAVAPNYTVLVLGRAVAGAFAGVMAANVLAIVGDVFPDVRRGTAMGVIMSSFSVASILGVPAGLYAANVLGWRAPFALLGALSLAMWLLAATVLPPIRGHLHQTHEPPLNPLGVLTHPNHVRAYLLMVALVLSTFVIIPYLSIYLVDNVGLRDMDLGYVWLCGGLATLVTTPLFGRLADRYGKLRLFRVLALSALLPTALLTNLPRVPLAGVLAVTTCFMVATSGRMVPAMALITASAGPRVRGSFLSVNSSVQTMAMGLAPLVSALILGEAESGTALRGFPVVGCLAMGFMLTTLGLAGRLRPAREDTAERLVVPPREQQAEPSAVSG